jgi:hypothetical protein
MPAPLAPIVGLLFGVLFAWSAREEIARAQGAPWVGWRTLALVALFSVLVFAPACAYFLAFESDWSYAYYVDTRRIPSALELALVLVDAASVPLGFLIGIAPVRTRRLLPVRRVVVPAAFLVLGSVLFAASRLKVQASYAQFHGDFGTRPVAGGSLGYALLWMDSLLFFGCVFTMQKLRHVGRDRPSSRIERAPDDMG